jgi:hypothetical protein
MSKQNYLELAIERWSAWAPGMSSEGEWREWAAGFKKIEGPVDPDVKFVKPMMRRRLSPLTRMAFRTAANCLLEGEPAPIYVFCSRYGEYSRTYGLLNALADDEPLSALAFSMSVHNTASSLFSIERGDTARSTSLAGGDATLEAAFVEAWGLLSANEAPSVLVIYHDEPLPDIYHCQPAVVTYPTSLAFLVKQTCLSKTAPRLKLEWCANRNNPVDHASPMNPALQVLKMILGYGDSLSVDAGRMSWKWTVMEMEQNC